MAVDSEVEDYNGQLGDGIKRPTILESDDERERCPTCGRWFKNIGNHWVQTDCRYPPITQEKIEILKGFMMGDGCVDRNSSTPYIKVANTNKRMLKWLSVRLGWLAKSVRKAETATESANSAGDEFAEGLTPENCRDIYETRTRCHPTLERFKSWYDGGKVRYPPNLEPSREQMRSWYISDGCLEWERRHKGEKSTIILSSLNESNRPETIVSLFNAIGLDISNGNNGTNFRLPPSQTSDFFDFIGHTATPGFEYKWQYRDYGKYKHYKQRTPKWHCTQTLE